MESFFRERDERERKGSVLLLSTLCSNSFQRAAQLLHRAFFSIPFSSLGAVFELQLSVPVTEKNPQRRGRTEPSLPMTTSLPSPATKVPALSLMRVSLLSLLLLLCVSDARELRRGRDDPCAPSEVRTGRIEGVVPAITGNIFFALATGSRSLLFR